MSFKYRSEVDGLRAVAVVPVILFHGDLGPFSGGYVGVDVFFVISGYLITSIILAESAAGKFTLLGFYERRARRILPALVFVILTCFPLAWLWMLPDQFDDFARSVVAVTLFASNILFFLENNYFAPAAELMPLLHTWSLAVEEQFYLAFPVFMIVFWRFGLRWLIAGISIIAVLSLAYAQLGGNLNFSAPYIEPDPQWFSQPRFANFYLPFGRAWELMLGALVAFYLFRRPQPQGQLGNWAAMAGLALIVYAIFTFDEHLPFPSIYTLVPTLGTALILLFATPSSPAGWLLSRQIFVGIGLISYSAYLWHQPLFAFARLGSLNAPEPWVFAALSGLTMLLAYLSWRYVERPFRDRRSMGRSTIFTSAALASAAMIALGVTVHTSAGFERRLPAEARQMLAYIERPPTIPCREGTGADPASPCVMGADTRPSIAIWGDSHAEQLADAFAEGAAEHGLGIKAFTQSACVPITGLFHVVQRDESNCQLYNEAVFSALEEDPDITHIVLSARWALYLEGSTFDNGEGGRENDPAYPMAPVDDESWRQSDAERRSLVAARYQASVRRLLELGKTIILVYPVPEVGWHVPRYLVQARWHGVPVEEPLSTSHTHFKARNAAVYTAFDALADAERLVRVDPANIFCDSYVEGRCVAQQLDGAPLYFDDDHLNRLGGTLLLRAILDAADLAEPGV